ARAIRVRRLRAEAIDQLGARGLVAWHANSEEIVVEHIEPLLDEREVRTPILALDAELGERLEPGRDDALAAAAVEILEHERLAPSVAQRAVAIRPAGGGKEIARLAQVVAQTGRWIGRRRKRHFLLEHLRRQL